MGAFSKANGLEKEKVPFGQKKSKGSFGTKPSRIKKRAAKNILSNNDKDFLQWLQTRSDSVCFVCGMRNPNDEIEWHHVKERSSDKKDNTRLIPLCGSKHHRNGELSPHGNAKRWRRTFNMKLQLDYAKVIYEEYLRSIK